MVAMNALEKKNTYIPPMFEEEEASSDYSISEFTSDSDSDDPATYKAKDGSNARSYMEKLVTKARCISIIKHRESYARADMNDTES